MIFGLLSLADLAQNDVLQFHPFTWFSGDIVADKKKKVLPD
jgi:hypothetical protein